MKTIETNSNKTHCSNTLGKTLLATTLAAGTMFSASSQAEMYWSDNSISLLYGDQYAVIEEEQSVMTIEHASGHNWGSAFFFMDRLIGETGSKETYSELSPRFSLSALTGEKLSFGAVKDVFIATTYESGVNSSGFAQDNYLYGVSADWDAPGFAFLQTSVYYADNENVDDDEQLTIAFGVPFSIGSLDMMFDGYLDWSTKQDDHAEDIHFNPQLKANVGKYLGITKSKLEMGIEYSYWKNKFGLKDLPIDTDENAVSAIIKFHL